MKVCKMLLFGLVAMVSMTGSLFAGDGAVSGNSISSNSYRLSSPPVREFSKLTLERLLNAKKIPAFVLDGATICADLGEQGIWRSTDGGASWSGVKVQPTNRRIRGLVIHPASRSTFFAATYGGGIFTSADAGNTWTACANSGLSGAALNSVSLAIDPAGTLYAGTEAGIFRSSDCSSWSAVNKGLTLDPGKPPVAIAIDQSAPARLYAGLDGGGIFTSSDRGGTWAPAATGPANRRIKALAGAAAGMFAATYGNGVVTSSDNGATWKVCANAGLPHMNVNSLLLDADGTLYAGTERGVSMSSDSCATWTTLVGGDPK